MSADPLEALRLPIVPVQPRPEFAAMLLRRIEQRDNPVQGATVRYFVTDVIRAVEFYCDVLDFQTELTPSGAFAMLYRGDLRLLLSAPSAAHALPDGSVPEPGGWNRISLRVDDLAATVEVLRARGAQFRSGVISGVGANHVVIADPAGNLVEVFEPGAAYHERTPDSAG